MLRLRSRGLIPQSHRGPMAAAVIGNKRPGFTPTAGPRPPKLLWYPSPVAHCWKESCTSVPGDKKCEIHKLWGAPEAKAMLAIHPPSGCRG